MPHRGRQCPANRCPATTECPARLDDVGDADHVTVQPCHNSHSTRPNRTSRHGAPLSAQNTEAARRTFDVTRSSPAWAGLAKSVFLVAAIEDWLGLELASDTAMEHPTIAQLSRFVAGRLDLKSRWRTDPPLASFERFGFRSAPNRWSMCLTGARPKNPTRKLSVRPGTRGAHLNLTYAELRRRARAVAAASRNALSGVIARYCCSRLDWNSLWRSSAASPRA